MRNILRKVWRRGLSLAPVEGFTFGRPLLILQSDDWGRVGVRDREGWEDLRSLGVELGERSYDFYSLETADDVAAIASLLDRHRDSTGRPACLGMNFIVANVDFGKVQADDFRQIYLCALTEGLPEGWRRPGLFEAYREGISAGVFSPALHGTTHFCRQAAMRHLNGRGERGDLLRKFWKSGVPYIHWRMPWIGFEYWDSDLPDGVFISAEDQEHLINYAARNFAEFFSQTPRSACAPGYRADQITHKAWAKCGVQVAQNGPGSARAPHFDANGILHLYRSIDFEPAVAQGFSVNACLRAVEDCFLRGLPAIVSIHSINFHSSLKDFRSQTIGLLDQFLTALEVKHRDLLYVRDQDLCDLVDNGILQSTASALRVPVIKQKFAAKPVAAEDRT